MEDVGPAPPRVGDERGLETGRHRAHQLRSSPVLAVAILERGGSLRWCDARLQSGECLPGKLRPGHGRDRDPGAQRPVRMGRVVGRSTGKNGAAILVQGDVAADDDASRGHRMMVPPATRAMQLMRDRRTRLCRSRSPSRCRNAQPSQGCRESLLHQKAEPERGPDFRDVFQFPGWQGKPLSAEPAPSRIASRSPRPANGAPARAQIPASGCSSGAPATDYAAAPLLRTRSSTPGHPSDLERRHIGLPTLMVRTPSSPTVD